MNSLTALRDIIMDIMDVEGEAITEETYLVRDLGAESIDLLELSVDNKNNYRISVKDDDIYLRNFRFFLVEAERLMKEPAAYLLESFLFPTFERFAEMLGDLEAGPAIKFKDLISYIAFQRKG